MKKENKNSVSIIVKSNKKGAGAKIADKMMVIAKKNIKKK